MKKWLLITLALSVIMIGLMSVIPNAQEQNKSRKWEYKVIINATLGNLERKLNELGAEGWELVTTQQNGVAYLKREITE